MKPNKWYWFLPVYVPNNGYWRENNVEWLGENNWGAIFSMNYDYFVDIATNEPSTTNFDLMTEAAFTLCAEYDVPVMLLLNSLFYPYDFMHSWNQYGDTNLTNLAVTKAKDVTYWERYNALFTYIEERWEGTIYGYWQESAVDNAATWLRSFTDLHIHQGVPHTNWRRAGYPTNIIGNGSESNTTAMDRRLRIVDGVDIELWSVYDILQDSQLPEFGAWIREHFSGMPIGLNSIAHAGPLNIVDPSVAWPVAPAGDPIPANFRTQTQRFYECANIVKDEIGKFDILSVQSEGGNETTRYFDVTMWGVTKTDPTWWEWQQSEMELWLTFGFTENVNNVDLTQLAVEV